MNQSLFDTLKLGNRGSLPGSLRTARRFMSRHLWVWPVIAAVLLGGVGWWVHDSMERAMRKQMADGLTTILNADVTSLRTWMKEQESNAQILAADDKMLPMTRDLLRVSKLEAKAAPPEALEPMRAHLRSRLAIFGYTDFFLVSPSKHVLAASQPEAVGRPLTAYRKQFFTEVLAGKPRVSLPYRSMLMLNDEKGVFKAGLPTMLTAAPIRDETGKPIAVLGLRIRPEGVFTEILQVARSGESGETYAFGKSGLLLSQSRFDDDLKTIGLLADQPDANSILMVELRDPGVNMAEGGRPALKRGDQPLTRMAADAIEGRRGIDVEGYRNYRGVPVVGAWVWLPEYDFGVATEVDVAEAYQPLRVLRLAFWILLGLLVLSALAIFLFTIIVARQEVAVQKAVLAAKQLGQYTLEEKIGAGGMGSVYKARHALLRRPTAVKLLEPDKISEIAIARFEREVQLTSQLNHPNTIAIYDFGRTPEGVFFYAMEYLDGINLENLVAQFGALPAGRVIAILRQVCGSLAEAHGLGLIHRDIKPANIIVNHRGGSADFVKVLDFGLARAIGGEAESRLTAANVMAGTPLYMAPEAIEHPTSVDTAADLYAVGAVAYFLLTGVPVFVGDSLVEICMKHVKTEPAPPSERLGKAVSPRLESIILKCLAKSASDRPLNAHNLDAELSACAGECAWSTADAEKWWREFKAGACTGATLQPKTDEPLQTVAFAKEGAGGAAS
jgi:tRNA A-37 threonylcarbamoyl transferase component Bud32